MNKQETLSLIEEKMAQGIITRDDVRVLLKDHSAPATPAETSKNLTNVFYIIGGIIALVGVLILVMQNWEEIGFFGRMLVTLGVAASTYASGLMFKKNEERILSQVLLTISAILAPIGTFVFLNEYRVRIDGITQFWIWIGLLAIYACAYALIRRNILILVMATFASLAYFSILSQFIVVSGNLFEYACMILGVSVFLAAYYIHTNVPLSHPDEKRERRIVENILHADATILVIAPALFIGGVFDFLAILLIFGGFYLSVYLRSRMVLILSAFFLMIHIFKLTAMHFADSIGWPLALIVLGFLVIAIGYGTLYLGRTYIVQKEKHN